MPPCCPVLIDCHTHTNMPGDGRSGEKVNLDDTDDIRFVCARPKNVSVAFGVWGHDCFATAGAWHDTAFSLRQSVESGLVQGSRVLASGRPITVNRRTPLVHGGRGRRCRGCAQPGTPTDQAESRFSSRSQPLAVAHPPATLTVRPSPSPKMVHTGGRSPQPGAGRWARPLPLHRRHQECPDRRCRHGVCTAFFCESDGTYRFRP